MRLLVLGASARAAAQSAARAGFSPVCGDLFADADLRQLQPCHVARHYPRGLAEIARQLPIMPWMFTGGLENWPGLVGRISNRHMLLGNSPEILRQVRNPFIVSHALTARGIEVPECRTLRDPPDRDGGWLLKNRRASGGSHVTMWDHDAPLPAAGPQTAWYFQRRVTGAACGAVFVAAGGKSQLVGVTEQLLSDEASACFRYAGSMGPLPLTATQESFIARVGEILAAAFRLRGLFGVDLLLDGDSVHPVEINPRYTASIEVLERATGVRSLALHWQACSEGTLPDCHSRRTARWYGKRVVYAKRSQVVSDKQTSAWLKENARHAWPSLADIPAGGTQLQAGQPVLTVFGEANDRASLLQVLADRRGAVEECLHV